MTATTVSDTLQRDLRDMQRRLDDIERRTSMMPGDNTVAIAYRNAAQTAGAGGFTVVKVDTIVVDQGKNVDTTNGWYVVPAEGVYCVDGTIAMTGIAAKIAVIASIFVNSSEQIRGARIVTPEAGIYNVVVSGLVFCKLGQKIELAGYNGGAAATFEIGGQQNRLMIVRAG